MNLNSTIVWAKGHPDTIIPTKRDEDACRDIYARFDEDIFIFAPHETKMIPTDLHCAMPEEYALKLWERGSTGSIGLGLRAGVIDSGYRGKIFVATTNLNGHHIVIARKEWIEENELIFGRLYQNKLVAFDESPDQYIDVLFYPYEKAICQAHVVEVLELQSEEITLDELLAIDSERGETKLGESGK